MNELLHAYVLRSLYMEMLDPFYLSDFIEHAVEYV